VRQALDGEPFAAPTSLRLNGGGLARPLGRVHAALERIAVPANRGRAGAAAVAAAGVNGAGQPHDAAWAASRWSPPDLASAHTSEAAAGGPLPRAVR
jgi:hypothetical protein